MSTTSQDYIDALWAVQNNRPSIAHAPLMGDDEMILDIDLDKRTIDAPKSLGVQNDHQSSTIYFRVDRYFDNQDLATKNCIIQYKNANGDEYIYPVASYDMRTYAAYDAVRGNDSPSQILIPWNVQGPATQYKGTLKFSVKFFKLNTNKEIIYELNTIPAETQILEGQNWDLSDFDQADFTMDNDFLQNLMAVQALANDGFSMQWVEA